MEEILKVISSLGTIDNLLFILVGLAITVKLQDIEFQLKRIAGPPKPIVKLRRYDKYGDALYEVDANIEIVNGDAKNFVQNDKDGRIVCDGVSVVYTELGKRRYLK